MTRRRSLAVVAVVAVGTVALAVGIAQGSDGSTGDTQVATIDADVASADVRPCPGAAPVGQLDPGDTVALTGRSEDGAWLRLRSPLDEDEQVWIDATLVVVTTPDDLPIARCGDIDIAIELIGGAELVLAPKTTTTTVAPGGPTTTGPTGSTTTGPDGTGATTTEPPGTRVTTAPGTGPRPTTPATPTTTRPRTTTTQRPTTTTTAPPDTSPPTISEFARSTHLVYEIGNASCRPPTAVRLSARVHDSSGLQSVRLIWRLADEGGRTVAGGNIAMQAAGGDRYDAVVGYFDQLLPDGTRGTVHWRVRATDGSPAANAVLSGEVTDLTVAVASC